MQPAEYWLCDNLAAGLASSDLEDCRITGRALTKRSMRTPTVEICDIRRNGSTRDTRFALISPNAPKSHSLEVP